MNTMTRLHIEKGETQWATWCGRFPGYVAHDTMLEAIEAVVEESLVSEGHRVIVTNSPEVLELSGILRDASGAEICTPFDGESSRRSRRTAMAGSRQEFIMATDASVRRRGRSTVAIAALGSPGITVSAHQVPQIGVHAAEVAGILLGVQKTVFGAEPKRRRIVCDSQGAVRDVLSMEGLDDREIAVLCEKLFGSWSYGTFGRKLFDGARQAAQEQKSQTLSVEWIKGHDDDAKSVEHDLNVVADQTARALSQFKGEVSEAQKGQVRGVAEAICGARFPDATFVAGHSLR